MKQILFYLLLVVQLSVILFLVYQFEQIDRDGQQIKLETITPDYPIDDAYFDGSVYVDYEINQIKKEQWDDIESVNYNDRVFVLLKSDESGIYHVEKVSLKKITATSEADVVLKGNYQYEDEERNFYYVSFGMEEIKNIERFDPIPKTKKFVVTVLLGKWGQYKVTGIENGK